MERMSDTTVLTFRDTLQTHSPWQFPPRYYPRGAMSVEGPSASQCHRSDPADQGRADHWEEDRCWRLDREQSTHELPREQRRSPLFPRPGRASVLLYLRPRWQPWRVSFH